MKKAIIAAGLVLLVVLVAALTKQLNRSGPNSRRVTGIVVHEMRPGHDFWGLETSFSWRDPLRPRKLRFQDLPIEYQMVGTRVEVVYEVTDVIGISDWDVVIDPVNVKQAER